jgi:hypothetical protein
MNLLVVDDFDMSHVVFMHPIKNIIMNGTFSRLLYTTDIFTTNGLFVNHTPNIADMERDILAAYGSSKTQHLYFKHCTHKKSILKISGIWESPTEYGIAYKIINR